MKKLLNSQLKQYLTRPLSKIYTIGYYIDRFIHLLLTYKAKKPVISIGNIISGGAGKTTLTIQIANHFKDKGINCVILSRGYRRKGKGICMVKPHGDPLIFGDEPILISQLTNLPVILGKNRVASIKNALKYLNNLDLFILDDGFQYYRLIRDLNILLIDATTPIEYYHILPYGRLREPLTSIKRADLVVITRSNLSDKAKLIYLKSIIKSIKEDIPIYNAPLVILRWLNLKNETIQPPNSTTLLSGIGNPKSFETLIKKSNIHIKEHIIFKDHHHYTRWDISGLNQKKPIITTAKDAIKIRYLLNDSLRSNIFYPEVGFALPFYFYEQLEKMIGI